MNSKNIELTENARILFNMRKRVLIVIAVIVLVIASIGCTTKVKEKLNVEIIQEVEYLCSDESKVEATFYKLTDNSLEFVKVRIIDKEEYTLPHMISASGVRYSDEYRIQFWVKGNTMTLYMKREDGEWEIVKDGKVKE